MAAPPAWAVGHVPCSPCLVAVKSRRLESLGRLAAQTRGRCSGWCRALAANHPLLVDGNSVVVKTVGRGEALIGLTDSDDVAAGQAEGLPVVPLGMTEETLLIPNTVAVVTGAPHPEAAQGLFDYLQRGEVVQQLVAAHALEGMSTSEVLTPTLKVNWDVLLRDLEGTTAQLNRVFLR